MKKISKMFNETSNRVKVTVNNLFGIISSVSGNGKTANAQSFHGSELRELRIMLPYGVSSSVLDGATVQVIINGEHNAIVGVYDAARPNVVPGEMILYSKFGAKISLLQDGNINIESTANINMTATGNVNISGSVINLNEG